MKFFILLLATIFLVQLNWTSGDVSKPVQPVKPPSKPVQPTAKTTRPPVPLPGDDTPAGNAAKKKAGELLRWEYKAPYEAQLLKDAFIDCCPDNVSTQKFLAALAVFENKIRIQ